MFKPKNRIRLQGQRIRCRPSLMFLLCLMVLILSVSQVNRAAAHALWQVADRDSPYADWPVIASLERVGNDANEVVEFTLDDCTAMRLYALGESSSGRMVDYATIENADTGQAIWQMYNFETDPDGWSLNRRVDRPFSLPAGNYRLRFRTNSSHAFDDWNKQPPQYRFWGVALYLDISVDHPASTCWTYAERPEDLGWSSHRLEALTPLLEEANVAALIIITDGQVVYEWGNTANNFKAHSMRKSLLSALYGLAIADGKIDRASTLAELNIDDRKPLTDIEKQATVADLLKARSGVYIPAAGEAASMKANRPQRGSHAPGTFWYYNNWDFNALGTIFDQESGQENIYTAFKAWIADPLGMQDLDITRLSYYFEGQSIHPYYGFRISARDLARFGQLYLQQGVWQDEQIVPAEWVAESVTPYSPTSGSGTYGGYGYMWWIAADDHWAIPQGAFAGSGYGGHTVEVLPALNTVIVLRINSDDPTVRLLENGREVDLLMIPIIRASNKIQIHDPYQLAGVALFIWGILAAVSLVVLFWSLMSERVASKYIGLIWAAIVTFFGPCGLLVYWFFYRRPILRKINLPNWQRALGASITNATGNILGILLVTISFIVLLPSEDIGPLALLGPILVGWLVFRAPLFAFWTGQRYGLALRRILLAEVMSTILVIAFALPVITYLEQYWHPYAWRLDSPLFWVLFLLAAFVGTIVTYPLNLWMARSFSIWPFQAAAEKSTSLPVLRNAWGALLVCIFCLVVSIGVVG